MAELKEGDRAPDFELTDGDGTTWRLSELKGGRVIVYFYPTDDTPGCTTQACDFRDQRDDFAAAGYTVLGVSPQDPESHRRFTTKYDLNFPLLVDADLAVARAYGAVKAKDEEQGDRLRIKRSTFVIDEDGRLASVQYGVRAQEHVATLRSMLGV